MPILGRFHNSNRISPLLATNIFHILIDKKRKDRLLPSQDKIP
jgi:hypothetical protein